MGKLEKSKLLLLRQLTDCFDLWIDVLQAMLAVACRPSQCRKHNSSRSTRRYASSSTTWIAAGRRRPSRRYESDCATGTATCRCLTSTCSSRCSRCLWPTRKSTSPVRASDSIRSPHPTVPLTPKVFEHYSTQCSCARSRSRRTPSHVSRSLAALGARAVLLSSSPVSSPSRIDSISLIDWSANLSGRDGQPFQRMHKHSRNRYIHNSTRIELSTGYGYDCILCMRCTSETTACDVRVVLQCLLSSPLFWLLHCHYLICSAHIRNCIISTCPYGASHRLYSQPHLCNLIPSVSISTVSVVKSDSPRLLFFSLLFSIDCALFWSLHIN